MTYKEFIDNILKTRGRFAVIGYKERHHILPRCMGGGDDEDNLIDLTPEEHYIAHRLLAEENPNNYSLLLAYKCMSIPGYTSSRNHKTMLHVSAEDYADMKKLLNETPMPKELRDTISVATKAGMQKRKDSMSEEEYKAECEDKQLRLEASMLTKYGYKNYSQTPEGRKRMSEDRMGENNPMYGHTNGKKVRCVETGIIYESATDACLELGFDVSKERSIRKHCNGIAYTKKIPFGYHWEFVD